MMRAFITGLKGSALSRKERAFLRDAQPWGVILFRRNIETPDQVRRLVSDVRDALGRSDAPILIDQEGGRVQRAGPPHWPTYPPGAAYGRLYDRDQKAGLTAARLGARLIAADLAALGITVNCIPVADVPVREADPVIGDRAYGEDPDKVAAIGRAIAEGLAEGGVLPVVKHLPGHGRATVDSHERLPVVGADIAMLEASDFRPFRALNDLPLGMTAHVVFSAIDPMQPATTSPTIIRQVIRSSIGFAGALMSDDISMGALSGTIAERTRAAIAAGCDLVLHCNGTIEEMEVVAAEVPRLAGAAAERTAAALGARGAPSSIDVAAARQEFATLIEIPQIIAGATG
jgi:beta-N-acetylhexosaminidase